MHRRPMPPLRTPSPLHVPRGRRPPPYTGCGHAAGRQLWSTRQTRRVPIGVHGPSDRRGGTMPFGTSGAGMGMKRPSTGLKANQQHSRPGSLPIRNQMETCSCRMAQDAKKALTGFEEGVVERRVSTAVTDCRHHQASGICTHVPWSGDCVAKASLSRSEDGASPFVPPGIPMTGGRPPLCARHHV